MSVLKRMVTDENARCCYIAEASVSNAQTRQSSDLAELEGANTRDTTTNVYQQRELTDGMAIAYENYINGEWIESGRATRSRFEPRERRRGRRTVPGIDA